MFYEKVKDIPVSHVLRFVGLHIRSSAALRELLASFTPHRVTVCTTTINDDIIPDDGEVNAIPDSNRIIQYHKDLVARVSKGEDPQNAWRECTLAHTCEYYFYTYDREWNIALSTIEKYHPDMRIDFEGLRRCVGIDERPKAPCTMKYAREVSYRINDHIITPATITVMDRIHITQRRGIEMHDPLIFMSLNELYNLRLGDTLRVQVSGNINRVESLIEQGIISV